MNKKAKRIILFLIAILFIFIFVLSYAYQHKKIHNPEGTVGSANGNTNNGGYFCEYDGSIYFSNSYDNNTLYSMDSDLTHVKKLTKVPVSQINVANGYIYFYQTNTKKGSDLGSVIKSYGIYRCKLNGDDLTCLKKCVCQNMILLDDYIYFQYYNERNTFVFSRININGGDVEVISESLINPSSAEAGIIYYNGVDSDHYLYKYNTETDISTLLYSGNVWFPVIQNGYAYYLDLDNHYRLSCLNLNTAELTVLSDERVDYFAVSDTYIYFQTANVDVPALKRVRTDGTDTEIVTVGTYNNISITSEYVYFCSYGSTAPIYRQQISGPIYVDEFKEARSAAMEQ